MIRMSKTSSEKLTTRERLLIGGIGALMPLVANLLMVDLQMVLRHAELYSVIGYAIRVTLLFGVGVLVAYLHDDETNKIKVLQFGMAAPAMLVATLNGSQLSDTTVTPVPQPVVMVAPSRIIEPEPESQDPDGEDQISPALPPTSNPMAPARNTVEPSATSQFLKGFALKSSESQ